MYTLLLCFMFLCFVFLLTDSFLKVLECDECQKVGKPLTATQSLDCIEVNVNSGMLILYNSS